MNNPQHVYELLLDHATSDNLVESVNIGLVWTLCKAQNCGLAMSPQLPTRTLPWSGTLVGKPLSELCVWINEWDAYQATIGMAAINAAINAQPLPSGISLPAGNLAVFEHFLPQLIGKKVVVIGRYPHIERYAEQIDLQIIERQPTDGDYPDSACEFLLPKADWVFLTATSLINKTFPRLAELSQHATTVLMGPTTPWLPQLADFCIDYLAGVEITDAEKLQQTIAEGGGVRIFEIGVRYRVVDLTR
ncbi:MAG: DUF364 domain-containing protein [Methylococcales bacterium]